MDAEDDPFATLVDVFFAFSSVSFAFSASTWSSACFPSSTAEQVGEAGGSKAECHELVGDGLSRSCAVSGSDMRHATVE